MKRRVIMILLTIIAFIFTAIAVEADDPAQPYNLTVDNLTDTTADLTWETPTPHNSDRWLIYKRQTWGTWYKAGTSTTKSFTATVNDMSNSYQFKVYGEAGSTPWQGITSPSSEIITVPAKPINLTVSNLTDTTATLTWTTSSPHGADRWLIYKRQMYGNWVQAGYSTSKTFTVSVNDMNNSYQFKVYGEAGNTPWSGTKSLSSDIVTVPARPTNLSVSNLTGTSVKVSWTTPSPHGADRWLIYKRQTNGNWVQAGYSTSKYFTVSVNDLTNSYQFRVYGEAGNTEWEGTKSRPSEIITIPAKPNNLTTSDITNTSVKLTWTTSSPHGADRWLIYKKASGGNWVQAGIAGVKNYTVTGLNPSTSYQFKVYGEAGLTEWAGIKSLSSSIVSCTTLNTLSPDALQTAFYNSPRGGDWDGVCGLQCPDLVKWFVDNYTDLTGVSCNGKDMVNSIIAANSGANLTVSTTPTPFSVFSVDEYCEEMGSTSNPYGHTGLVLSVNTSTHKCTILHTGNSATGQNPNSWVDEYPYNVDGVTFVDISNHLN